MIARWTAATSPDPVVEIAGYRRLISASRTPNGSNERTSRKRTQTGQDQVELLLRDQTRRSCLRHYKTRIDPALSKGFQVERQQIKCVTRRCVSSSQAILLCTVCSHNRASTHQGTHLLRVLASHRTGLKSNTCFVWSSRR